MYQELELNNKKTNTILKNRFHKASYKIANKYVKKCSTSLVNKEMKN